MSMDDAGSKPTRKQWSVKHRRGSPEQFLSVLSIKKYFNAMIFTVSKQKLPHYKYVQHLSDCWYLHTTQDISQGLIGYRLGTIGGNFISWQKTQQSAEVHFSFFKDFNLYQDTEKGILLSNDPLNCGIAINNDVIKLEMCGAQYKMYTLDWKSYAKPVINQNTDYVIQQISHRITSNLLHCADIAQQPIKIVYTGGLDSSLLAFLAHYHGLDFECVVNNQHKNLFSGLPFNNVIYKNSSVRNDQWGEQHNIQESYYDYNMNDCITGFFGDTTLIHNSTLYYQCRKLQPCPVEIYDRALVQTNHEFSNRIQVNLSIIKILKSTRFRQWFDDFRILDPYRDPEITKLILQMPWNLLTKQFGDAWIQKHMIDVLDKTWSKFLLKNKNEYANI